MATDPSLTFVLSVANAYFRRPCFLRMLGPRLQAKLTGRYARTEDYAAIREALRALSVQGRMDKDGFGKKLAAASDGKATDPADQRMANLVKHDIVLIVRGNVEFQSRAARRFAAIMPATDGGDTASVGNPS